MTFQDELNAAQSSTQQANVMNSFIQFYIDTKLNDLKELVLGGAPETLDTLKELADAISGDPEFFSTMSTANAALQTAIDAVQADVDQNEADADTAIAAETAARGVAITGEATTRQAAIDAVNALITTLQTEAAARLVRIEALEADATTATAVAAVQADVDQNETDSDAADAALSGRLDVLEADPTTATAVAAVQSDVDQNEVDSDAADAALSARLDTLEADPTTQTALDAEIARATSVEGGLATDKLNVANPAATGQLTVDTNARVQFDSNLTKVENVLRGTGIDIGNNIQMKPAAAGGRVEVAGSFQIDITEVPEYSNDTQAAAGGIIIGGLYRSGSVLHIRVA